MHSIYGASEYKHKLELTPANILGKALQFRKYRVKNPLSITFRRCIEEMITSGQYIPGFRWLTTAKISKLRAKRIWHACTSPESVEVPDMEAIFFGVKTATRYFENQEEKMTTGNQDAKIDEDRELGGHSRPADDDGELAADDCESTPAHDEEASTIPVVELDKAVNNGADLETLCHALLEAGFAVVPDDEQYNDNPGPSIQRAENRPPTDESSESTIAATIKFEIQQATNKLATRQGIGPIDPSEYLEELALSRKATEDQGHFVNRKRFP
ncbi:hypothetical protein R1flu_014378 [Riccia fluitans]|uniref:Uncharacterized protein n=1 Tax=Riccia fluitans TaxID=41844 RepID=A0ABD1YJQ4_9MARC